MNTTELLLFSSNKHYTFGQKTDQPLSTAVTSRTVSRRSTALDTDVITITGGTYQLRTDGVWGAATAAAGTWGTADAIRAVVTSANVYRDDPDSDVTVTITIDGVDFPFVVVTMEEQYLEYQENGTVPWLLESGTIVSQEGYV